MTNGGKIRDKEEIGKKKKVELFGCAKIGGKKNKKLIPTLFFISSLICMKITKRLCFPH